MAGRSADFDRSLKTLTLFGERIVFFRKTDAPALADACPYRKLPLSKGVQKGNRVVCSHHGLTFDKMGSCVAAPTHEAAPQ